MGILREIPVMMRGTVKGKKHKKKKKSKSKEKFIPDDKINIEVDAKLGQKILSMFVSGDMLQDVLKKEAKNTETAIQSIKKALEKKQYKDEKRKKKKKKGKDRKETDNDDQKEDVEKKLKSLDAAHAKYESKMAELLHSSSSRSPSRSTECS